MAVNNLICLPRFHRNYEVCAEELNESELNFLRVPEVCIMQIKMRLIIIF